MEKRNVEKITSLIFAVFLIILSVIGPPSFSDVGIYAGCPLQGRLLYPFFHVNIVHAMLNTWCFLAMMFVYDISLWRILAAYIISFTIPVDFINEHITDLTLPTVGLSGMVFFLFASISFEVARKTYYQAWMIFYLVAGFILPGTNAVLHLYCYLAGVIYALINKPFNALG